MIKFFRKIRQNMITENKSALPADRISKYLLYAFGEIVLVVIGILIALQVSNWNENRKNRIFEKTMLRNIQEDIIQDTLDLGFNIEVYKKALQNEKLLLRLLNKDSTITVDSINFVEALSVPLIAVVHKSSFNNLIYNNPNLISNKELKKKIDLEKNCLNLEPEIGQRPYFASGNILERN